MRWFLVAVTAFLLLAACTHQATWQSNVPNVPGEVLYHDVLLQNIPADQVRVFGTGLGDNQSHIEAILGKPDVSQDYQFGKIRNIEYDLGQNKSAVLYHLVEGKVQGILVTQAANPFLVNQTVIRHNLSDIYGLFGVPTLSQDLQKERIFYYDKLGYQVFINSQGMERIFFTTPNQGIKPVGQTVNQTNQTLCAQVLTTAENTSSGECRTFNTPCDVPSGWTMVPNCNATNTTG